MGILNYTSDSFYDGGKYDQLDKAVNRVGQMLEEGATIIDIGAFSSRPGAIIPSSQEQLDKLGPLITALVKSFPEVNMSIDTYSSEVVKELAAIKPFLVNDISAGEWDPQLWETVANLGLPYVLMHMRGRPADMDQKTDYIDMLFDLMKFFSQKLRELSGLGISDLIIDPGFGFAKSREQNFKLINELSTFHVLDRPLLVGISNKSMIYKTIGVTKDEATNGTTAMHMVALQNGAAILRAHNVQYALETINLWEELNNAC